jgi:hypothetical protein
LNTRRISVRQDVRHIVGRSRAPRFGATQSKRHAGGVVDVGIDQQTGARRPVTPKPQRRPLSHQEGFRSVPYCLRRRMSHEFARVKDEGCREW